MITKPTVLVLGAGASMHLGYPSGRSLMVKILDDVLLENSKYYSTFLLSLPNTINKQFINEFRNALYFSGMGSIDTFLEGRPEFDLIGKLAIATVLLACESGPLLFSKDIDNWYEHLYHAMVDTSLESFNENKLSIITFNYDKSIEWYLFTALQHKYGKRANEVAKVMMKFPIIHVHGQLGNLPWQSKDGSSYGANWNDVNSLHNAAKGIKIIYEAKDEDEAFAGAREMLKNANRIIFLGFGYNNTNIRRLMMNFSARNGQSIDGTCYGMTSLEVSNVIGKFSPFIQTTDNIPIPLSINYPNYTVLQFLRASINF